MFVRQVTIYLGDHLQAAVPHQLRHRRHVHAVQDGVGAEGVTQEVDAHIVRETSLVPTVAE